jgi:hypothetical protein
LLGSLEIDRSTADPVAAAHAIWRMSGVSRFKLCPERDLLDIGMRSSERDVLVNPIAADVEAAMPRTLNLSARDAVVDVRATTVAHDAGPGSGYFDRSRRHIPVWDHGDDRTRRAG